LTLKVVEATDGHGKDVLRLAKVDPVLNVFIIYDWMSLRDRCGFYVALDDSGRVKAVCMIYHDRGFDSIVFCGSEKGVEIVLDHVKPVRAVMPMVEFKYMKAVSRSLGHNIGSVYDCMLMVCSRDMFKPKVRHRVLKLEDRHADILRSFWVEKRGREISVEEAKELLGKPTFAVVSGGRILSIANILAVTSAVSMIGGVYTIPEFRGRGLATSVVSKATEEALKLSRLSTLVVRSENLPAVRLYRKVGYEPYKRLKWVCVGVDVKP